MIYHIVTTRDYNSIDEFEIGVTESLQEARRIAQDEQHRIERDREKYESVEIRVYEDEDLQLDYNTMDIAPATMIKSIREMRGMSQSQLAELTGISVRVIQNYEQGTRPLSGARAITVYQIAKALRCSIEDLLDLSNL